MFQRSKQGAPFPEKGNIGYKYTVCTFKVEFPTSCVNNVNEGDKHLSDCMLGQFLGHPFFFSVSSLSPFRIIGLPHGKRTYVDGGEKKKKRVNE